MEKEQVKRSFIIRLQTLKNRVSRFWRRKKKRSWYFNFSVIAPSFFFLWVFWQVPWVCVRERERACVRARVYVCVCARVCIWKLAILFLVSRLFFNTHNNNNINNNKKRKHHVVVELKGITDWTLIFGCSWPHMDQRMIHDCNYEQFKLTHVFI